MREERGPRDVQRRFMLSDTSAENSPRGRNRALANRTLASPGSFALVPDTAISSRLLGAGLLCESTLCSISGRQIAELNVRRQAVGSRQRPASCLGLARSQEIRPREGRYRRKVDVEMSLVRLRCIT
jgi:hypothetical protein